MSSTKYTAWNGGTLTFDELYEGLGNYIAHLLLQITPYEHVSDCKQEAMLKLWLVLQDDPEWINRRGFKTISGLAWRLAYDGRQQHAAWGPVQRLYESRVVNEATLNDYLHDEADDEHDYIAVGGHSSTMDADFWRDLSEIEPRNLDPILYQNGHDPDWQDLADMRIDLYAAIKHVFDQMHPDWYERTLWAIMCLVYNVTIEQAAFMVGITRPAMNHHVIRCRKLMQEKLASYQHDA